MAPPGPVLCVAPAGSGKTTTIVARVAWLVASGSPPASIAAITFNRRAAVELERRLGEALGPLDVPDGGIRVRTFHALALEILADSPRGPAAIADRGSVLRDVVPAAGAVELARLDTAISRLKVEHGVDPAEVAADVAGDADAGPIARAFVAYQAALMARGEIDFDDLVLGALRWLAADEASLERWRGRSGHLLVDEVQDVDRAQLQLALVLAAPANRIFMVGDDDQSIYGWRLADVRRILDLDRRLPGLRRFQLVVNYRCPRPVVERSTRLIARNRERFPKVIRAGPQAAGRLVLAPDGRDDDERIGLALDRWPADGSSRAVLARTNAELVPAAAAAIERGIAYQAGELRLPLDGSAVEAAMASLLDAATDEPEVPLLILIGRLRANSDPGSNRASPRSWAGLPASRTRLPWSPRPGTSAIGRDGCGPTARASAC